MKKFLLLLAAGALAGVANGQAARTSVLDGPQSVANSRHYSGAAVSLAGTTESHDGARTTVAYGPHDRWYDYADSFFALAYSAAPCHAGVPSISGTLITFWNDTTAEFGFSGGTYGGNNWVSVGLGCRPFDSWWNSSTFAGEMAVTATDAYTVDSVIAVGIYGRNPAKPLVVDSMRFDFVYGNGSGSTGDLPAFYFTGMATDYCYDTLRYLQMFHDSLNNRATNASGTSITSTTSSSRYFGFPINITDTATVTSFQKPFGLPGGGYLVPAGNAFAASVSFKSGDATYPTTGLPPRDTVQHADGSFKYGCFLPEIVFNGVGTTTVDWAHYEPAGDWTSGYFKRDGNTDAGWGGYYIPTWAWSTSTGASVLQYPHMVYHVHCPTCVAISSSVEVKNVTEINNVRVYPNPTGSSLNIEFAAGQNSSVSVTLTNVVGQVVASQDNVTNGKATFDISNMMSGVYFYTITSSSQHTTGRVVVAH